MKTADLTQSNSRASLQAWLAVIAVALAIFIVVSAEMLPIGLLTPIAESMQQPLGNTSLIISMPSLIAAITAPCVILIFNHINRRKLLLLFMLILFVSTLTFAIADAFYWLLFARVLFGIAMGGIWSLAGSLAVRLVPTAQVGLATSIIFSGVAAASVLGVPMGVYLGDLFGWRMAFISLAGCIAIIFLMLWWSLPSLAVQQRNSWKNALIVLKKTSIIIGLALTLLIVTGQFASYTFIRPLLQEMAHFPDSAIGILLLIYGIFGILGNFILGFTIQKFLWQTLFVIASLLSITLFLFMFLGHSPLLSILLLFIWGLAYGGVSVSLMTWMIRSAPDHIELGSAFNIAIFNLSIGLGAFLGGVIYDGIGLEINLVFSCILTCLAAILVLSYRHR
ncbi:MULTISPECIES: MFS transporter [unclassified Acinetobacter]|uniref:MFS transporter n=1 Tax=unclassified Acinetobacter TaxID=196816 RepID=UPI0029348EA8|nr:MULTISPECIES: MFS transporter [unclassified Acinetobacter]WOE31462.1 MFS transporter [Acinetobacter sp. SAAs470]WOE39658.1 MFS transporter [Acinetobacter sp. SAAs474]